MPEIATAFQTAFYMVVAFDPDLMEIVGRSLQVNFAAVGAAILVGLPLGAAIAIFHFPGRKVLAVFLNALMGMPPVVVGLIVYLLLSRAGPFGVLGLLFTPAAMIIAQFLLILPIIAALTRQTVEDLWTEYREQRRSLNASLPQTLVTLLWEGRFSLSTTVLAGFGRASGEVGAVMIVGGNIDHLTRIMTTAIALEVSKGDLSLALGLGIILITLSVFISGAATLMNEFARLRFQTPGNL